MKNARVLSKRQILAIVLGGAGLAISGWGLYGSLGWIAVLIFIGAAIPPAIMVYLVRANMRHSKRDVG